MKKNLPSTFDSEGRSKGRRRVGKEEGRNKKGGGEREGGRACMGNTSHVILTMTGFYPAVHSF